MIIGNCAFAPWVSIYLVTFHSTLFSYTFSLDGSYSIMTFDEFADKLLSEDSVCETQLPRLTLRRILEETEGLPKRRSKLAKALGIAIDSDGSDVEDNRRSRSKSIESDRYVSRIPSVESSNSTSQSPKRQMEVDKSQSPSSDRYVSQSPSPERFVSRSPSPP